MRETAARHGRTTAEARKHEEGMAARTIEGGTARLRSDLCVRAAFIASMGVSLALPARGPEA